jgi:hypothetical protein
MHVLCLRATADGVARLLGTHTRGTHYSSRAVHCLPFFRSAGSSHAPVYAVLRTAHPYTPASAFWDCAHRSSPYWAHTRPHLSRSLALRCTAKESIPRPHLHRSRIHPSPTSAPLRLPSGTSASAQQRCDTAQCVATKHNVLQPHPLCFNRVPAVNDPAADGTFSNRLHAAALPCDWLHPIQSKQVKRGRRWRVRGTVDEYCLRQARPCL